MNLRVLSYIFTKVLIIFAYIFIYLFIGSFIYSFLEVYVREKLNFDKYYKSEIDEMFIKMIVVLAWPIFIVIGLLYILLIILYLNFSKPIISILVKILTAIANIKKK